MIISGLTITLSSKDPAARADAIAAMRTRPELTLGELTERWLPVALDARDDEHSREVHDWLLTLPAVDYVDVVSVNFETTT